MKLAVAVGLLGLLFSQVVGEPCTTNGDCTTTICGTGSILCQHPDGQGVTENGGLCTCAAAEESACVNAADCYLPAHPELNCDNDSRHCYDQRCICDRFVVGGIGR